MRLLSASLRRRLRSPRLIVSELLAFAFAGVLGASLPQAGSASAAELARLRDGLGPLAAPFEILGLDHVFRSGPFVALTLLAAISLSLVIADQLRRVRSAWREPMTEAAFGNAPMRAAFERTPRLGDTAVLAPVVRFETRGRLGLFGSPLFHLGLFLVIVAGASRALFSVEAATTVVEGETIAETPAAWPAQWPGRFAAPFSLAIPVRLDKVRPSRYPDGGLRDLAVELTLAEGSSARRSRLGINRELELGSGRLFLGSEFGPAALLQWTGRDGNGKREALLLEPDGSGFAGEGLAPSGSVAHLRTGLGPRGPRPQLELRVVRGPALLVATPLVEGAEVALPDGDRLTLAGLPYWVRLRGSRDPALPLAYAGFVLVVAGATLIFTVIRVDSCVVVRRAGELERVEVRLKAQRLAPLFRERFARLVQAEGGVVA